MKFSCTIKENISWWNEIFERILGDNDALKKKKENYEIEYRETSYNCNFKELFHLRNMIFDTCR